MTSTMNTITYFCCDSECDKEVAHYGAPCCLEHNPLVGGLDETLSHETSECPGCGMDLYVGANGYCSYCWVDRFGCEDDDFSTESFVNFSHEAPPCSPIEHKCCGEWDYERGIRVCDFDDEPACPQYRSESEIRKNCECEHSPLCKPCEVFYGYDDQLDGETYNCRNCKREFKNKYWRNQSLCRDCEDLPPLPPSPVDVEEDIAQAMEKLEVGGRAMTPGQYNDWDAILKSRQKRMMTCTGCRDDVLNQQGHMGPGGCLDEPECTPWEDYDTDDLRKLDMQMRHMYC